MQQADMAGSTRTNTASRGERAKFSTLTVNLTLDIDGPLITRNLMANDKTRMQEVDSRLDNLKAFIALLIGTEDLDDHATKVMGHIWQSLDDMRVLTSEMVGTGRVS